MRNLTILAAASFGFGLAIFVGQPANSNQPRNSCTGLTDRDCVCKIIEKYCIQAPCPN